MFNKFYFKSSLFFHWFISNNNKNEHKVTDNNNLKQKKVLKNALPLIVFVVCISNLV